MYQCQIMLIQNYLKSFQIFHFTIEVYGMFDFNDVKKLFWKAGVNTELLIEQIDEIDQVIIFPWFGWMCFSNFFVALFCYRVRLRTKFAFDSISPFVAIVCEDFIMDSNSQFITSFDFFDKISVI